jgi:hypothetical protein
MYEYTTVMFLSRRELEGVLQKRSLAGWKLVNVSYFELRIGVCKGMVVMERDIDDMAL